MQLHYRTTPIQFLQYPRQHLHSQFLQLIILAIVLLVTALVITTLLLMLLARISTLWSLGVSTLLSTLLVTVRRRHGRWSALEVDVHYPRIIFGRVLQPQLLAHLFDSRLDLLDMVHGVISFAHDAKIRNVKTQFRPGRICTYTCK